MSHLSEKIRFLLRPLLDRANLKLASTGENDVHLKSAMDWLCYAQDVTVDDGVAQTYLVRRKHWANSYPETTGYIIPTFYNYAALTNNEQIRERARRMTAWECSIQHPDGGVLAGALGDSDQPTIFNTGQVLFGWIRAFQEEGEEQFRHSAIKAADWLLSVQDEDGCWRKFGSPMTGKQINTYNTRTAWGLARIQLITGEKKYLEAAVRNIEWALTQRNEHGWLRENCLQDNTQPFVHTIAYAMRGIMEVGVMTDREDFIAAAQVIGDALIPHIKANGLLPGRFDQNWNPTVAWSCLTGCAQISINWARLYQITGQDKYRQASRKVNGFLKATQKLTGDIAERGGIKGSHPINGGYHPWQYPNWPTKFYADALMMEEVVFADKLGWNHQNDG